jgi:hypothetical protein
LTITFSIFLGIFCAFYGHADNAKSAVTGRLDELRSQWVGQYPHKGDTFFLNEPKIKDPLLQMLGQNRFEALETGQYLEVPIDYVEGCYVLSFGSNPHLTQNQEWIYIIIREYTGSIHIAIKDDEDRVQWMHTAESDMPSPVLKMLDLWDSIR